MTAERREAPPTAEGWYALHDFRAVDWDAWRDAPERERAAAVEEGRAYLSAVTDEDAAGESAVYAVVGGEADLLVVHLRPSLDDLSHLERRLEGTSLGAFVDQQDAYVSVTEAGGYSERAREYFEGDLDQDSGLARYIESRLYPTIPDEGYVCFYPMDKRRDPEYNWYDLPFEERVEHMSAHGEIGREYGGQVTQMITGSIGFDDWEWGVTLWGEDPTTFKDLLYEMRFDPSSSKYAEFGPFTVGRRIAPGDLEAFLDGDPVPADQTAGGGAAAGHPHGDAGDGQAHGEAAGHPHSGEETGHPHGGDGDGHPHGDDAGEAAAGDAEGGGPEPVREELADLDVYAGQPHGEDVYALVVYSTAESDELFEAVRGLRANFDHYDTHVKTAMYRPAGGEGDAAVVSIWETERAADTAAGFLNDLPGTVRRAGEDGDDGWATMGMFYQVKPDRREDFVDTFEDVGDALAGMDGHRETRLLANDEDEADMFIDSRWDGREDAMAFFRSEEFAETVEWGREVLADRPRHVFLA